MIPAVVSGPPGRISELLAEFECGNFGKTILGSVGVVKEQFDNDGLAILQDGVATVSALKILFARYLREHDQAG